MPQKVHLALKARENRGAARKLCISKVVRASPVASF